MHAFIFFCKQTTWQQAATLSKLQNLTCLLVCSAKLLQATAPNPQNTAVPLCSPTHSPSLHCPLLCSSISVRIGFESYLQASAE